MRPPSSKTAARVKSQKARRLAAPLASKDFKLAFASRYRLRKYALAALNQDVFADIAQSVL